MNREQIGDEIITKRLQVKLDSRVTERFKSYSKPRGLPITKIIAIFIESKLTEKEFTRIVSDYKKQLQKNNKSYHLGVFK